jgi:hypothetical protein
LTTERYRINTLSKIFVTHGHVHGSVTIANVTWPWPKMLLTPMFIQHSNSLLKMFLTNEKNTTLIAIFHESNIYLINVTKPTIHRSKKNCFYAKPIVFVTIIQLITVSRAFATFAWYAILYYYRSDSHLGAGPSVSIRNKNN